ncbi:MAG: trypsin-like peptidase domain-containing protein [Candidatus Bathyarchaeia archaeon]|jgi:S1-C subfamily serine protease
MLRKEKRPATSLDSNIYISKLLPKIVATNTYKEAKPTENPTKKPKSKLAILIATILIIGTLTAGVAGYYISQLTTSTNNSQQNQTPTTSNQQTQSSTSSIASTAQTDVTSADNTQLSKIYQQVEPSVVVIQDFQTQSDIFRNAYYTQVQGSGFVYDLSGKDLIITNYHVIDSGINITVTFQDGNTYTAKVLGSDPYSDIAVLSTDAPQTELFPLTITNSSTLQVGDQVIAIGSPYGLAGSMTTGIISALGRTITEDTANGYAIADIIQTSVAINPGNSGGPLLNSQGEVIGITTAILDNSQGLGFAIPSDTILRETQDLADNGAYNQHPYLGISGADMTYDIATQTGVNVTYGVLIQQVTSGGPADKAGLKAGTTLTTIDGNPITTGGDIIIALNGNRIRNSDDLSTYLEENTLPGQTVNLTILRNNQTTNISVELGTRPAPTST